MIKDIVEAAGAGFLIPAVLAALLVAAAKALFGWFGRKSQIRKEFLEHWDAARANDDLWLEVTVRHQFGEYLPAQVIRMALGEPHKTQALQDISTIWPLFRLDPATLQVSWKGWTHATKRRRTGYRWLLFVAPFCVAFAALGAAFVSYTAATNSLGALVYGALSVELFVASLLLVDQEDASKTALRDGDRWLLRINQVLLPKAPKAGNDSDP